jgi:hypothetical protein
MKVVQDMALSPNRCWFDTVVLQDPLDRVAAEVVTNVPQGASKARVSPARVLLGHLDQQLDDLVWLWWPTGTTLLAAVVLLGHELSIPAEDRIGAGDAGDLAQRLASERLC